MTPPQDRITSENPTEGPDNQRPLNVQPDTPCQEDHLGFDTYVATIGAMIRDPDFQTPFCIGIFGPWGIGKTSFMRLLEKALIEKKGTPRPIPVWFNPWRYEKEDHLIIPFLKTIERGIERYREEARDLVEEIAEKLKSAAGRIGRASAAFAYGLAADCKLGPFGFKLDAAKMIDREEALEQRRRQEAAGYARQLSSIYYDIIDELKGAVDEKQFRIVVFIDDLDRCMPEKAVELLESIKLFLDIEGYLFVLGVDKKVVRKGIAYRYRHFQQQESADPETTISPEDYLEKMIQLPIDLPPIEPGHKIRYIRSLVGKDGPYSRHADLIARGVGENPRALKRFINLLAFTGRLADTVRENLLKDPQIRGTERATLVKDHFAPALYLKWAIIVFRYPDEYNRIKGNPGRLFRFQRQARATDQAEAPGDEKTAADIPEGLRAVLAADPPFPEDEWLIRHFIHLAKVTDIAVRKEARTASPATRLKPGDWVTIPKGKFLYGDDRKERVIDDDYDIDAFPVTQRQYKAFIDETPDQPVPYVEEEDWAKAYNWDRKAKTFPKGLDDHPVVLVSHEDAKAFCRWRSKKEEGTVRLPTEMEWEKAARGEDGRAYPWGDEFDPERCNTEESGIGRTTPVTRYPEGRSPYDAHDMAGNVWEWTDSFYDNSKKTYTLRGGSWFNSRDDARCANRNHNLPSNRDVGVGFRCVRTQK